MLLGKKKGDSKFSDGISSSYRLWHDKLVQAVRLVMPPECPYTVVHVGDMIGVGVHPSLAVRSLTGFVSSLTALQLHLRQVVRVG